MYMEQAIKKNELKNKPKLKITDKNLFKNVIRFLLTTKKIKGFKKEGDTIIFNNLVDRDFVKYNFSL